MSKIFSLTEVSEKLNKSRQQVWNYYNDGKFPNAKKIGNYIGIPEADLKAFIDNNGGTAT